MCLCSRPNAPPLQRILRADDEVLEENDDLEEIGEIEPSDDGDLDDGDLDDGDLDDGDLDDGDLDDGGDEAGELDDDEEDGDSAVEPVKAKNDDEDAEDEEEDDPDDVEADLDTILKDRIAAAEEEEDEEEIAEPEPTGDGVGRILPKRPGEFVCQSCFLVKHPNQLANAKRKLCSDCV